MAALCYTFELLSEKAFVILLTAVALGVRAYLSTTLYFNFDECLHANAGSSMQLALYHHPPLLLCWIWLATLVSSQEWWLRLVPVLAGGLTPLAAGLWMRRFLSPVTAWGLAALVAVAPNIVLLSIQLRGYSLAMLATLAAVYALDRALEEGTRKWMLWHFAALYLAILSEFGVAWVTLAAGLYALAVFIRQPATRRLLPVWIGGQCVAAFLYLGLYVLIVRPVADATHVSALIATYLAGAFPRAGQNRMVFVAFGVLKQFVYVAGGTPSGVIAGLFALGGLFTWYKAGNRRWVLVAGQYLAAAGAIGMFYPFGRTRHTVLIGLLSLAATGAGIDAMFRQWRAPMCGLIIALAFLAPFGDVHNPPFEEWQKSRWERALRGMDEAVPAGAPLLGDSEAIHMLRTRLMPRNQRRVEEEMTRNVVYKGRFVTPMSGFDWGAVTTAEIKAALRDRPGPVWLVDTGFVVGTLKPREAELGLVTVIYDPGVLYLGRVR